MAILDRDHPYINQVLYDQNAHRKDDATKEYWKDGLDLVLESDNWDAILVGSLITGYNYVKGTINRAKKILPDVPIVAGGGWFSCLPQEMMDWLPIDYGVIGEAYLSLPELLKAMDQSEDPEHVDGIVYRKKDLQFTLPREIIPDLDYTIITS